MFPSFWAGYLYIKNLWLIICITVAVIYVRFVWVKFFINNIFVHASYNYIVTCFTGKGFSNFSSTKICRKKICNFFIVKISERYTFTKVIHQQIFNLLIIEINICYNFIEHISKKWYNIASQCYLVPVIQRRG